MKRILITVINGFVGANFTNSWSSNNKLFGLDIRQPDKEGDMKYIYSVLPYYYR